MFARVINRIVKWRESTFHKNYRRIIQKYPLTVLCFHDVGKKVDNRYTISERDLVNIMNSISELVVPIGATLKKKDGNRKYILTFDDGYESIYHVVYPLCKEKGIPFTVFIATDFIDKPGYLKRSEIASLAGDKEICTIGSHMCSHRKTREMQPDEIRSEWKNSKSVLEEITKDVILHAALPYGSVASCSFRSIKMCYESGYETLSTTLDIPFKGRKTLPRRVYQNNREFIL